MGAAPDINAMRTCDVLQGCRQLGSTCLFLIDDEREFADGVHVQEGYATAGPIINDAISLW